jgi:hypothetical protein
MNKSNLRYNYPVIIHCALLLLCSVISLDPYVCSVHSIMFTHVQINIVVLIDVSRTYKKVPIHLGQTTICGPSSEVDKPGYV